MPDCAAFSATLSIGSSLKFCTIAEGKADLYLRSGPTWEWDTAAGQAIVTAAGGRVSAQGQPLGYNKASLKNGAFAVASQSAILENQNSNFLQVVKWI